jgi:hypothetical protein
MPNPKTGLVMLPEVVTSTRALGSLLSTAVKNSAKILVYNQHTNFEYGSAFN